MTSPAMLRLLSDLKAIKQEPPEVRQKSWTRNRPARAPSFCQSWPRPFVGFRQRLSGKSGVAKKTLVLVTRCAQGCSASPACEDNLFVWNATVSVAPRGSRALLALLCNGRDPSLPRQNLACIPLNCLPLAGVRPRRYTMGRWVAGGKSTSQTGNSPTSNSR